MFHLVVEIGNLVIKNILQIITGSIISAVIYLTLKEKKFRPQNKGLLFSIMILALGSFLGIIMPLGIFGIIPIICTIVGIGVEAGFILPIVVSNIMFNMLVPFSDTTFTWSHAPGRMSIAFLAGWVIGIIFSFKKITDKVVNLEILDKISPEYTGLSKPADIAKYIISNINILGLYVVFGAAAAGIFNRYVYVNLLGSIMSGSIGTAAQNIYAGHDVTGPLFVLAATIILGLMDFIKLSGLLAITNVKGIIGCYIYYGVWAVVLAGAVFLT